MDSELGQEYDYLCVCVCVRVCEYVRVRVSWQECVHGRVSFSHSRMFQSMMTDGLFALIASRRSKH